MTGAYSSLKLNAVPSFMILEFRTAEIVVYEYSLEEGELKCVDSKIPKPWTNLQSYFDRFISNLYVNSYIQILIKLYYWFEKKERKGGILRIVINRDLIEML